MCLHGSLWLLLGLVVAGTGGKTPNWHASESLVTPVQTPVPVGKLENLFASDQWPRPNADTNLPSLFFTRYFVPPPSPAPPPPPTTRKIEITYQGYYESAGGPRETIIKVADSFVVAQIGTAIANQLFVADATMQSLTLTNLQAQTNVLSVNAKREIEVPIK